MSWSEMIALGAYRARLVHAAMALTEPRGRATADHFQILVYHRIGGDSDPFVFALGAAEFEGHIRAAQRHFTIRPLGQLLEASARAEVPARSIALTFDDGYEDLYTHAFPILRRLGVPSTVYVTTGLLDRDEGMWNDRVAVAIRDTDKTALDCIPGTGGLPLGWRDRARTLETALESLKARPPREREALVAGVERSLGASKRRAPRLLRSHQIVEMSRAGVDFGAHTVTHPILSSLSLAEAEYEIVESKRRMEELVQRPVVDFAYPNGRREDFSPEMKRLLRANGYRSAVTTIGDTNTRKTDPFELRRCGPLALSPSLFVTKLWWNRRATGDAERAVHGGGA